MLSHHPPADTPGVIRTLRLAAAPLILMGSVSLSACVSARHLNVPAPPPASAPLAAPTSVVDFARSLVGTPYRWGGSTPDGGFDCSGFVMYVMAAEDIAMPRTVSEQYRVGSAVAWNRLRAGDLVFFTTTGPGATHVGIVVDAEHQEFVHAPTDGSLVRVDRLDTDYWRRRWIGSRRVL